MESAKAKIRYITHARVVSVKQHFEKRYVRGWGETAEYEKVSLGWYIHLQGSHEAIYIGMSEPPFSASDLVQITFEKKEPLITKGIPGANLGQTSK